jgi:hypothetical protein
MSNLYDVWLRTILFSVFSLWAITGHAQSWQWAAAPTTTNGFSTIVKSATDRAGNTVVVGLYSNAVTFGSTTLVSPGESMFVARLNNSGSLTQVVDVQAPGNIQPRAIALDGNGDIVVAGRFSNSVSFGSITLSSSGFVSNIFVARLNPSGIWTQAVQTNTAQSTSADVGAIAVDATGNVVIAGNFDGTSVNFGSITLNNIDASLTYQDSDIFVAQLSSSGTWTQAVRAGSRANQGAGGQATDAATCIAIDASGAVVVAGNFNRPTIEFGSIVLTSNNGSLQI